MPIVDVNLSRWRVSTGVSYRYWYPEEASTLYLYEAYPDVSALGFLSTAESTVTSSGVTLSRLAFFKPRRCGVKRRRRRERLGGTVGSVLFVVFFHFAAVRPRTSVPSVRSPLSRNIYIYIERENAADGRVNWPPTTEFVGSLPRQCRRANVIFFISASARVYAYVYRVSQDRKTRGLLAELCFRDTRVLNLRYAWVSFVPPPRRARR